MPVTKFPYQDTLVPIEKLRKKYPYASNLVSAVILERCLRDFISKKGIGQKLIFGNKKSFLGKSEKQIADKLEENRVTLGQIVRFIKENLKKYYRTNLRKIVDLRNDYVHSNKRTESNNPDKLKRIKQYKADNKKFEKLLVWVQKEQYF